MSITRNEKSANEVELVLQLPISDYEPKLKSELQKYRQKANMKGFRKGKVPVSVIKKMYGRGILADLINEMLQKELSGYITDEKLDILGQPLPSESQETYDFEINNLVDFEFRFDVGLAPAFEVAGIEGESYEQLKVEVTDEMIDDELEATQKRAGNMENQESDFEESDGITFNAKELEGDALKNKGFETSFKVLIQDIQDEDLRKQVLESKIGDTVRFDIFDLEKDKTDEYVRKYLLQLDEEEMDREVGREFEATIEQVDRLIPAELNEEFYNKAFGEGEVTSEEEARAKIKEHIENMYKGQSEALLYRSFQERLLELNTPALPDEFLKRWLKSGQETLNDEDLDKQYPDFEKGLLWSLIERKIGEKFEVEVGVEDVRQAMRDQLKQYMGGYAVEDSMLDGYVDRMMQNQEQVEKVFQEKRSDKIFEALKEAVTIEEKFLPLDEFEARLQEARAASQPEASAEEE